MAVPETWAELADRARARRPGDSPFPVPWGPQALDGGVWLARSAAEQAEEAGRCVVELQRLRASSSWANRSRARAVLGVDDASQWTRGRTRRAPVSGHDLAVTGEAIGFELAEADQVVQERRAGWERAGGAVVWLRWLTGLADSIGYPLE
jgi:hypothetical protein